MAARSILVPVDGSDYAREGLEYACDEFPDAALILLHVVSFPEATEEDVMTFEEATQWLEREHARATTILEEAARTATVHEDAISSDIRIGSPADAIVDYARSQDVDHIIMGSRGRTDAPDTQLGSVAELVMREAPVLVSVVR